MKIIRKLKYPITIIIFIFITMYIRHTKNNLEKNKFNDIEIVSNINNLEKKDENKDEIKKYNVDIKGAIKKPGVYDF